MISARSETHASPTARLADAGLSPAQVDQQRLAEVERALADRPNVTISLRISLSMLLCFLLVAGVVVASMLLVSRVGTLQQLLEKLSTYALEVEHARRYEKNYLLYGTGLDDALTQVQAAHRQLRSTSTGLVDLVGAPALAKLEDNLESYGRLLERLAALSRRQGANVPDEERTAVEWEVRRHGAQVVADASDVIDRERIRLTTSIRTSWVVAASSLFFIMLAMGAVTHTLTRLVANPLHRFVGYTERIAKGDFSPILPARPYRDEFSRLAVAINRMVFRLKEREHQLAQTSRMAAVGTLTAGIAHELNNPLNNIGLNAEALYDGLDTYSRPQKLKMLADIVSQVERASGTVRNLLDFTRIDKPVLVPVSLKDVVAEARRLVANEAEINRVEVRVAMPEDLPRVLGSPRDLQQVFLNLFLNAIQAMPDGGVLTVRGVVTTQGSAEVDVSDTGIGISEENIGSVFDPFFTTKEVGTGTGLGLFVSFGTIEKHNGSITVRSKVGEGTTFTIHLPVVPRAVSGAASCSEV
jgi:two-component system NtrC family sensor kinase